MKRYVAGVVKGVSAEPGTILGPNDTGEYMVVLSSVDGGVAVGYAQQGDIAAAGARIAEGDIRSVAEHRIQQKMH